MAAIGAVTTSGYRLWRLGSPKSRGALVVGRWFRRRVLELDAGPIWPRLARATTPPANESLERAHWRLLVRAWLRQRTVLSVLPSRVAELTRMGTSLGLFAGAAAEARSARLMRAHRLAVEARVQADSTQIADALSRQLQRVVVISAQALKARGVRERLMRRRVGWLVLADVTLQLVSLQRAGVNPVFDELLRAIPTVVKGLVGPRAQRA